MFFIRLLNLLLNMFFFFPGLSVRENVTLTDAETNGSTNSSSVAVAILVPFFALIFAGLGFYLYKQRYVVFSCLNHGSLASISVATFVYVYLEKVVHFQEFVLPAEF